MGVSEDAQTAMRDDRQARMDALLGYLLLAGVSLSMTLIVIGLFWHYLRTGHLWLDHRLEGMNLFQFVTQEVRLIAQGAIRPRVLVDMGVVVLLFTPYARVVASMFYFMLAAKDMKYTVFTAIVLAVLTFSLFLR
jgi:uncharacterized membrane protein